MLQTHTNSQSIKDQMISEALLIITTIEFIGKQIEKLMLEFEEAINNKDYSRAEQIEQEFLSCKRKIKHEDENIDKFMSKYKKIIEDEKKSILYDTVKKKQIHLRSISENQSRKKRRKSIQRKTRQRE
jgi:hypothetical protein